MFAYTYLKPKALRPMHTQKKNKKTSPYCYCCRDDTVTVDMDTPNNNKNHIDEYDNCYESHSYGNSGQAKSLYLSDGNRSIDFILAWYKSEDPAEEELHSIKRGIFEQNLINEGLVLEHDKFEAIFCTKIHAPIEVLRRYSEILKLRLPMKTVSNYTRCQQCLIKPISALVLLLVLMVNVHHTFLFFYHSVTLSGTRASTHKSFNRCCKLYNP